MFCASMKRTIRSDMVHHRKRNPGSAPHEEADAGEHYTWTISFFSPLVKDQFPALQPFRRQPIQLEPGEFGPPRPGTLVGALHPLAPGILVTGPTVNRIDPLRSLRSAGP